MNRHAADKPIKTARPEHNDVPDCTCDRFPLPHVASWHRRGDEHRPEPAR